MPWKIASCMENLVLQALQFQKTGGSATNSQVGQACHYDLMNALRRVNLMLAFIVTHV
jgi:hypothetical protein